MWRKTSERRVETWTKSSARSGNLRRLSRAAFSPMYPKAANARKTITASIFGKFSFASARSSRARPSKSSVNSTSLRSAAGNNLAKSRATSAKMASLAGFLTNCSSRLVLDALVTRQKFFPCTKSTFPKTKPPSTRLPSAWPLTKC